MYIGVPMTAWVSVRRPPGEVWCRILRMQRLERDAPVERLLTRFIDFRVHDRECARTKWVSHILPRAGSYRTPRPGDSSYGLL